MSENDFLHKISLLENLHEQGALIDADKIEYFSKEGKWEKINIEGLEKVPVSLYVGVSIDNDMNQIIYRVKYDMITPHINLTPSHTEKILFGMNSSKEKPYNIEYQSRPNEKYNEDDVFLRYDNKNINIFSKVCPQSVIFDYKLKNRKKLHNLVQLLNDNIKKNNQKTYLKTK